MTKSVRRLAHSTFSISSFVTQLAFILIFLLSGYSSHAADGIDMAKWNDGKAQFKANCASCHKAKEKMTGPALEGALQRWEDKAAYQGKSGKEWIHRWIHNWEDPVNAGNPYANEIKNYDPSAMNKFPNITDEQIDNILLYVDNSTIGGSGITTKTPVTPDPSKPTESDFPYGIVFGLIFILAIILIALNRVTKGLSGLVDEKKGEHAEAEKKWYQNWKVVTIIGLLLTVVFGYYLIQNATQLGRQQGYQPTQPIKFSHALHAGKHQIDCQYCHATASKSKHSNIPSISTCMNCHKVVQKGPKYGTEEIAKIYKYADYDVATKTYGNNPKPVEWIRIHNLPDHVYFSHQQHVKVGGVQCQTCHGPVQEMEEVYQYAPLSMGWCINCHRQTKVNFDANGYYKTYEKYHEALKEGKMKQVTVEDIGGTECQKCHY
jgi:mono/diheme cytochrome c family protein